MKKAMTYLAVSIVLMTTISAAILENSDEKITSTLKDLTTEAYYNFDETKFHETLGLCERVLENDSENPTALYYSAYSSYRLANIAITKNDVSLANKYVEIGIELAEQLKNDNDYGSEARVILAAIYMMKLTLNQNEAPVLSSKVHQLLGKAEGMDNSNPRVHVIRGIMLFHTPPQFGGSVSNAIVEFDKTAQLFENKTSKEKVIWGKYEAAAWKRIALQKQGKNEEARKVYESVIEEEPSFGWVKYDLLPSLNKTSEK